MHLLLKLVFFICHNLVETAATKKIKPFQIFRKQHGLNSHPSGFTQLDTLLDEAHHRFQQCDCLALSKILEVDANCDHKHKAPSVPTDPVTS